MRASAGVDLSSASDRPVAQRCNERVDGLEAVSSIFSDAAQLTPYDRRRRCNVPVRSRPSVTRHAASTVLVCQRPEGAWPRGRRRAARCPAVPPLRLARCCRFSSRHTERGRTSAGRRRRGPRDPRGRDVRPIVFGRGTDRFLSRSGTEGPSRARQTRRHTRGRGEGVLQLEPSVRSGCRRTQRVSSHWPV